MTTPKISVIVPVYKVEQYIHRCLDSILSQSFTDFELILVDDGSSDNCGKICDEYASKDSRVKVIHKENGGVSSARNIGLNNAKGEWITFIDADDYVEQGFLTIPNDTSEDLLVQNYKVLKETKCYNHTFDCSVIQFSQIKVFINERLVELIYRVPWGKFFKRTIIVENGLSFTEGVKIGEDTIFVLDYLYHVSSIRYLSNSNYVYKEDPNFLGRYKLPVNKCSMILGLILDRYNRLQLHSNSFLVFMYLFFFELISPKDYISLIRWNMDKSVIHICRILNYECGLKWIFKYHLYLVKKIFLLVLSKK